MGTSGKPIDRREREQIAQRRDEGQSVRRIAADLHVSTRTVQKHSDNKRDKR